MTFIIFFQTYMVAPIIPLLSKALQTSEQAAGMIVSAYLIPYGVSTLIYGPLGAAREWLRELVRRVRLA